MLNGVNEFSNDHNFTAAADTHTVPYPFHPKILVKGRYIIGNGVFRILHDNFGLKESLEVI